MHEQVEFDRSHVIDYIGTKGRFLENVNHTLSRQWVTSYKIIYNIDASASETFYPSPTDPAQPNVRMHAMSADFLILYVLESKRL